MADVMPQGHGGDGADEPPPGGFGRRGHHEEDLVPKKKTRGKAKNKKLLQANKMGGLVSIPFDRLATYTPVGDACDMFSREVGIYMWENLAFDKYSYTNVSAAEKNAMEQHLRRRFNFEEIERDRERRQLKGGIRSVYMKRYRDRKSMAKKEFIELGKRHDNLETIRCNPPTGMGVENWRKTIDLFGDPKYKKRCEVNKKNREKQLFANRGGSASYSSWSFKKNVEALETYAHAHTLPDGTFASPLEEENFNLLKEEFERQRTQNNPFLEDEGEIGESSAPAISNVQVFEKVFGARRGIYRGLGRKPSLSSASSDVSPHEKEKTRPQFSELSFDVILICSDHVLNILFVSICFS
ncbi:putative transposase, Ptta/En/Spm, plant [Helianthus annuus]|nr:putative transposase, Ptta/En/Spm, plant [Helianthus annuus]